MTPAEAKRINKAATRRLERSIVNIHRTIITEGLPQAMDDAGKIAVAHAKATHTYTNRTGALERSTNHALVGPNDTGSFEYESPDGRQSFPVSNHSPQWLLVIGAGMYYAKFVELTHGFDVVIQSVVKMRNEFGRLVTGKLRAFRIRN